MTQTLITPELIRAALAYISPNCDRAAWARVAMAIKSEYPDTTGRDLFTDWSAVGEGYDAKATRDTWRSVKAGGGVTVATLLHLAKEQGFVLPKPGQDAPKPDPQALAERERQRTQARQREEAKTQAAHASAASQATTLWDQAATRGESAYLVRKGVQAHGVRFADGWLLVPLRDEAGTLWNVQSIAPAPPEDGGPEKRFLKGGRKSGLWHLLTGEGHGDDHPMGQDYDGPLLVAEGYATAASLHQATGYPVAVAFDARNLGRVAQALRTLYPLARLVLAGDDDQDTQQRTGTNPGRKAASAAAKAVRGLAVFPAPLPAGGSDFNDLHQHQGGQAGLDAVRDCIAQALAAGQPGKRPGKTALASSASAGTSAGGRAGAGAGDEVGGSRDPFTLSDAGVWHQGIDQEGNPKPPEWVCSRLEVQAQTRDQDGGGWGYLLTFADPLGQPKTWAMPARMLSGDGNEYRATLLAQGLRIAPAPRARHLLTQYIQTRQPGRFAVCTDRIGWHGRAFVLPRESLGEDGERIVFQTDGQAENAFTSRGTPEAWRERVAALCQGNSRLVFAVACALAGPLLRPVGLESGGFHLRGDSSSGKTTALKVAASVYGSPKYMQRWRTTDNALELTAAQHCDALLILDELAQIDPKAAGECAYMLANEQSKGRSRAAGTLRPVLTWRLLFLSAGEVGLSDHMAEGMKRTRTGQEVRMCDIPADAGRGMGAFETLHEHEGGSAFSRHLVGQAASVYGATGRAWLLWLTQNTDTLKASARQLMQGIEAQIVPEAASGQVQRVGARFALVGAAGELATQAGLTGWPPGESEQAARDCFNAWLAGRGGLGNGEVVAMLRQVRRFLETHGDGRFTMWHRAADDHAPKTLSRAGVRRMLNAEGEPIKTNSRHAAEFGDQMPSDLGEGVSYEYFILPEVFRQEVCQGFSHDAVCRVLLDSGCLLPDKGRAFDCKPRLPGLGLTRCYRIPPAIFELDV